MYTLWKRAVFKEEHSESVNCSLFLFQFSHATFGNHEQLLSHHMDDLHINIWIMIAVQNFRAMRGFEALSLRHAHNLMTWKESCFSVFNYEKHEMLKGMASSFTSLEERWHKPVTLSESMPQNLGKPNFICQEPNFTFCRTIGFSLIKRTWHVPIALRFCNEMMAEKY